MDLNRNNQLVFLTKCREHLIEFLVTIVFTKVFDVNIGELHSFGAKLNLSFLTRLEVAIKPVDSLSWIVRRDSCGNRDIGQDRWVVPEGT